MVSTLLILTAGAFALSHGVSASIPQPAQRLRSTRPPTWERSAPIADTVIEKRYTIPVFANPKAANFHVDSSALPLVTFPLQDSWAGQIPVSSSLTEKNKLFFWYWPSSASGGSNSLTIWLNGGPGCSSLEGFLQENGPLRFSPGTTAPVLNQNGWTTASDVLYIEQPVGTGFAVGSVDIIGETDLANEFYGFLEQFYTIFKELASKKLYITGESYAGYYIPYIATRIVDASVLEKAALPLNLQALLINDGVYSSYIVGSTIPAARFAESHQAVLGLSDSAVADLKAKATSCGYDAAWAQVTYPPKGHIAFPNNGKDLVAPGCDLDDQLYTYATIDNPCFNIYRVTDKCPTPNDPIESYFSRSDVQSLIHVPNFGQWLECTNGFVFKFGIDPSKYTETLFPHLLNVLPHGITLWHGLDDAILMNEGDRMTIQNLTWGGLQGFQTPIDTPLIVNGTTVGVYHSERNLTYLEIENAGHMIPENQPVTALHVFNWVLGNSAL